MKHTPGKIYGPAGLVVVSGIFILMLFAGGIAIGFTRNNSSRLADRIAELDRQNRECADKCRAFEDEKTKILSPLSLRNRTEMKGLDVPGKDQLVTLRRTVTRDRPVERRVSSDPRFTALDIAFIDVVPARGAAVR